MPRSSNSTAITTAAAAVAAVAAATSSGPFQPHVGRLLRVTRLFLTGYGCASYIKASLLHRGGHAGFPGGLAGYQSGAGRDRPGGIVTPSTLTRRRVAHRPIAHDRDLLL